LSEKKTGLPVDPTSSLVSQIAAPFIPVEYETVRPYEVKSSEIDDMGGYTAYREIPGEYRITGFGTPPIVSGGIELFKQFMDDPAETAGGIASAVGEELKEYPARQLRTALSGGETFNPETGEVERFDPFAVPATVAAGTAVSIARTADKFGGGPVLGIMAGRRAKDGPSIFSQARAERNSGKSRQEIFDKTKAYFDDAVFGQDSDAFRFEIPTANSKFKEDGAVQFMNVEYGRGVAIGLTDDFRSMQFTKDGDLVNYNRKPIAKLSDILDFPELYEQYPEFKDVAVIKLEPDEGKLPFEGPRAMFAGRAESPLGVPTIGLTESQSSAELQSSLLHEIQHLVQVKEGFPGGASGAYVMALLDKELGGGVDKDFLKSVALPAYESVYGEIESRLVQRRYERPEEAKVDPVTIRKKEAPDDDINMTEYEAAERTADMIRELLEDGMYEYREVYPDAFKVNKMKDGGIVSLLDVARNTGRGPMGVASLSSTARNMNRPMVS
jgi:hypothetical protein